MKKYVIVEKIGQLFFWKRVLLDVTHTVELAVPTASASNIRTKRTPHHNVRLPEYREPSLLLILLDEKGFLLNYAKPIFRSSASAPAP